ncbi:MAG: hypothetical protein Q9208_006015 [Pyrenodesmia sp. 3 TL-2023]
MQKYGLTLKEPRRIPCTRPADTASTMWHDWKDEEYTGAVTNSRDDNRDLSSPNLDRRGADGDTNSSVEVPPRLARLPPELLDLILSFLPKDAELTLRLACPALYHRHCSQTVFSLLCNLRIDPDLAVRQRSRWISNSWLQRLPHQLPRGAFLPCSPCGAEHLRYCFSREEVWNQSGTRACLGWTRRLYLSPRHSMTLRQLLNAAQEGWEVARGITTIPNDSRPDFKLRLDDDDGFSSGGRRAYKPPRITDDDDDNDVINTAQPEEDDGRRTLSPSTAFDQALQQDSSSSDNRPPWISAVSMFWNDPNRHSHSCVAYYETSPSYRLEYDIRFPLPKTRRGLRPPLPAHSTKEYLQKHPFAFCPHLRSDDPRMAKMVGLLFEKGGSDLSCCRRRVDCWRCTTYLTPSLKMGLGRERVLDVRVHKNVGDLSSARNSVWLTQLT